MVGPIPKSYRRQFPLSLSTLRNPPFSLRPHADELDCQLWRGDHAPEIGPALFAQDHFCCLAGATTGDWCCRNPV